MTARPLPWFRAARRGWQRDAWVAFEGRAGDRAGSPTPGAHDAADPWVVDYQRGEIIALVQRLKAQDLRLERRTRALVAALAMLALGVIGAAAYGVWTTFSSTSATAVPPAVAVPVATARPGPPAPGPAPTAAERAAVSGQGLAAVDPTADVALPIERSPPSPDTVRQVPEPSPVGRAATSLPVQAPLHVTVTFAGDDPDARQLAAVLAEFLRSRGLAVGEPLPAALHPNVPGIAYYFEEDREGALSVERALGGLVGKSRLAARSAAEPLPRPGTVVVTMPAG